MAESRSRQRLSAENDELEPQNVDLTKNLPATVVLSLLEWLAITDLLAVGKVDRSFRDLAKEELPWKAAARHLWKSALLDGHGQALSVEAPDIHETARAANVTLQDICRSMVGAWPTSIDDEFRTRPADRLQASVDGVLQPFYIENVEPTPLFLSGSSSNDVARLLSRENRGLCSGVVFRGHLGGDRAVRANVPFPFLATMETHRGGARFKPSERDLAHGCVVMTAQTVYDPTALVQYPDEFLARVKNDAPFSLLWPGHAAKGNDGSGAADPAACGDNKNELQKELIRMELERLPSSGPKPFFHAGYTAYFEITLEESVPPLERREDEEVQLECVAIGLAYDSFRLTGRQPGWDMHSWGFHSDDGSFYHKGPISFTNPVKFGPGDTVGCGLLYARGLAHLDRRRVLGRPDALFARKDYRGGSDGAIFFTKNGRFLGIAFRQVDVKRPLYPVIGLDSHCLVTANFGAKAFAFDVPTFESFFTGSKLNCYAPSAPDENDETAIIKTVYSGRNGFTNPRLLCPYIRLTDVIEEDEEEREADRWAEVKKASRPTRNIFLGAALPSESKILRKSLGVNSTTFDEDPIGDVDGDSDEDPLGDIDGGLDEDVLDVIDEAFDEDLWDASFAF